MAMEALGRLVDVCIGAAPVDLSTAGATGKRVALKGAGGLTIVVFKGAGTAGDDPTFTLKQHTANTGGTTSNLAAIDHYYLKDAATLAGTEAWTKVTQAAAATIADPGGGTNAQLGAILYLRRDQLVNRAPAALAASL